MNFIYFAFVFCLNGARKFTYFVVISEYVVVVVVWYDDTYFSFAQSV